MKIPYVEDICGHSDDRARDALNEYLKEERSVSDLLSLIIRAENSLITKYLFDILLKHEDFVQRDDCGKKTLMSIACFCKTSTAHASLNELNIRKLLNYLDADQIRDGSHYPKLKEAADKISKKLIQEALLKCKPLYGMAQKEEKEPKKELAAKPKKPTPYTPINSYTLKNCK